MYIYIFFYLMCKFSSVCPHRYVCIVNMNFNTCTLEVAQQRIDLAEFCGPAQ